jgi:GLPGLI family protein
MKKIFFIISIFIFLHSFSQNGVVNYGYIESLTIGNGIGDDYNSILKFNDSQAQFISGKESLENPEKLNKETVYENPDGSGGYISSGLIVTPNGNQVITNLNENLMYSNIKYGKQYYLKDSIPIMKWKIFKNETKNIGNFICIKATTTFRGREYTAWFSTQIPVLFGPWKLNGLPGLILEAYDTNKNVYWYFKNIDYPVKDIVISSNIINEKLEEQKEFLNNQEFSKKLLELVEKTNEKSLIFSKQNDVDIKPIKYESVFLEKF